MMYTIGLSIFAAMAAQVHGAVIASNSFTGITGNTTTSATSAWTNGPDIGTASFGSTFTGTSAFRNFAGIDGGGNLSSSLNFASNPAVESVSFSVSTGASGLQLGQFSFRYYATTNAGNMQAASDPTGTFDLTITGGTTPIIIPAINVTDFRGATGNNGEQFVVGTINLGTTLAANTNYTFTLGIEATGSYITLDNFTLDTVPEPSAALLAGLGALGLLRRRR